MKRPWWARPPRWANLLAVATLALLAACGPGVGGSGTGEDQSALPPFGASAASLCGSELALLLQCPTGSTTTAAGTARVAFSGRLGGQDVALQLQGNQAELRVGCTLLRFRGQWGQLAPQPPRFYGYTDPDGVAAVATLEARLVGSEIELTLRDANGSIIVGPVLVAAGEARSC